MPRSAVKVTPSAKGKLWDLHNRAMDLEAKLVNATNAAKNAKNNNAGKNKDTAAAASEAVDRLRIPLCETMAEMLLADAEFSWHYKVVDRLFKHCFYDRIGPQRSEIARAKRRSQNNPQLAINLQASLNHFLAEAITLYEYLTDKLEKKLLPPGYSQTGEEEDASYTQTQSTHATTTADDGNDDAENLDAIVPVLNLLYIHLGDLCRYANELPRAQERYEIATRFGPGHGHAYNQIAVVCQLKEQQGSSPLSAVALYWYCRSLLPDVSPFHVANANLNRLFASNREWLLQQLQTLQLQNNNNPNDAVVVVTHATKAAAVRTFLAEFCDLQYDFYKGIISSTSTTMTTSPMAATAAASATTTTTAMVYKKIGKLTESLQGLLKLSAFGDALVCKMVTILAFSECHVPTLTAAAATGADENNTNNADASNSMLRATTLMARTTMYQMATLLADKVLATLRKLKAASAGAAGNGAKNANNNATSNINMSVRLLLPLLLVAEFTAHSEATFFTTTTTSTGASNSTTMDDSADHHHHHNDWMVTTSEYEVHYKQALQAFWKKIVDVWNLLHPLAIAMNVDETKVDGLQEYEALRGFAPFSSFITKSTCSTTTTTTPPVAAASTTTDDLPPGFLTAQESVQVILDKNYNAIINATKSDTAAVAAARNNNSTQESNSTKGSASSSQLEQGRIKIARMLGLAKTLADDLKSELGLCICRMSTGEYAWIEHKEQEATAVVMEQQQQQEDDDDDDHAMMDVIHDDNSNDSPQRQQVEPNHNSRNVTTSAPLVYQQAAGGGPALLVPGALLQNQALPYAALDQQNSAAAAPQLSAVAQFGNVGFDSNCMTTREQQQQQQGVNTGVDLHSMLLGEPSGIMGNMQPPAPVNPPPGFGVPPPPQPAPIAGFDMHNMGLMPPGLIGAISPSQPMQPMRDSLHFLGGVSLATANPFATTTADNSNNNSMHAATINGSIIPPLRQENTSFLGGDDDEMAGMDLLGSGLFNSLWGSGEDVNGSHSTNNPFAAS